MVQLCNNKSELAYSCTKRNPDPIKPGEDLGFQKGGGGANIMVGWLREVTTG